MYIKYTDLVELGHIIARSSTLDRDSNANINLQKYSTTDSLSESKACGDSKPLNNKSVKDSMKQEVNIKPIQLSLFE